MPDKKLRDWKPTNPGGYRRLFESRAQLMPRLRQAPGTMKSRTDVEPFPAKMSDRGVLRRTVQLLKRHRDIHFQNVTQEVAPISVVITTLAAQAYEFCVRNFIFDTEFDVLVDSIRMMPHFIEKRIHNGQMQYWIRNETTDGENFADRWNTETARVQAFYLWHAKALSDFEKTAAVEGIDIITMILQEGLGDPVVSRVMNARACHKRRSRKQ